MNSNNLSARSLQHFVFEGSLVILEESLSFKFILIVTCLSIADTHSFHKLQ